MKKKWFEGSKIINCNIQELKRSVMDHAKFFKDVVSHMRGLASVELIEHGRDYVMIKTNEEIMKHTNISISIEPDCVVMEFEEEYQAGRMVTTNSHYFEEFTTTKNGVSHRTVISDVNAPGILIFFIEHLEVKVKDCFGILQDLFRKASHTHANRNPARLHNASCTNGQGISNWLPTNR